VLPNLGAWTLERANSLSAGGPPALGFPLKITVSPDNTFFTTALFTIFLFIYIYICERKERKEKKRKRENKNIK
jgi:hypothetical protein